MRKDNIVSMFCVFAVALLLLSGCEPSSSSDDEVTTIIIDGSDLEDDEIVTYTGVYSADELREILASFDWEDTSPVPEKANDGSPKLYYVEMLVPTIEEIDELSDLGVPWDYLPLFDEELETGDEDVEIIDIVVIEEGRLVFAILPGEAYNLLRAEALAGTPPYPFIRLREIPGAYRLPDGTLDPEVLGR